MFGDAMLTVQGEGLGAPLPTLPQGARSLSVDERLPVGTRQKLVSISETVLFGWSGPEFLVPNLVRSLRAEFSEKRPQAVEVAAFMETYPQEDLRGLEYIVAVSEERGIRAFSTGQQFEVGPYKAIAIGSGAGALWEYLAKDSIGLPNGAPPVRTLASAFDFSFSTMLSQAHEDRGTSRGWGGAFEIAIGYNSEAPLLKLDQILVCAFGREADGKLQPSTPWYYMRYVEGCLVVIATHEDQTYQFQIVEPGGVGLGKVTFPLDIAFGMVACEVAPDSGAAAVTIEYFPADAPPQLALEPAENGSLKLIVSREWLNDLIENQPDKFTVREPLPYATTVAKQRPT